MHKLFNQQILNDAAGFQRESWLTESVEMQCHQKVIASRTGVTVAVVASETESC